MATLSPAEYLELKAFLRFFSERFFDLHKVEPRLRPLALLEASERAEPARAASELRMAVNDCVEKSGHWPLDQVSSLDAELRSIPLLTLSQVRQRHWGRYAAVLKRGLIRNQVEHDVVRGVLGDPSISLAVGERERLQALARAYEDAIASRPGRRRG
jgi:hypothetical protein